MNDATPAADQLVTIPEANMWKVVEFFEKLARRARRTKKAAPCYVEVGRETREVKASSIGLRLKGNPMVSRVYVTLQVAGNRPHIPDYTFIGTIQHEGEINVLNAAPDQDMPEEYRTAKTACDHCKTNRKRKDTYVMRNNASGLYRQIARNCLQDYLGEAADVKDMLNQFTWLNEAISFLGECVDYCGFGGESRGDREDIVHFLALTACTARVFGWTGRGVAREHDVVATASRVWRAMYPPTKTEAMERAELVKIVIIDEDLELATKALEWIRSRPESEQSGYIGNLVAACQSDTFRVRNDGLVASLVGAAYPNAMGFEKKRLERAEKPESQYVGEVGVRSQGLVAKVKVMKFHDNFAGNGYSTFCILEDAEGNVIVWSASADLEGVFCVGDVVTLDGTVKDHKLNSHEKFGDIKQTWLTRCTIKNVESQEEDAA